MEIRKARHEDLDELMQIYHKARKIMRESGNMHQWSDDYPAESDIMKDIGAGCCFVLEDADKETSRKKIKAVMAFISGPEPTYATIHHGRWPDDRPYHVIHRIAAGASGGRTAEIMLEWAFGQICEGTAIRIDTHRDNIIMHHILSKYGFEYCGIIHLADGSPRDAYCKSR